MNDAIEFMSPVLANGPSEWLAIDPERVEVLLPDPVYGLLTREQLRERERIAGRRWYLLENTLRFRSRATGRVERYFTLGEVARPFNGLDAVLAFVAHSLGADASMSETLEHMFAELVRLGTIVPISEARAAELRLDILLKTGIDICGPKQKRRA